MCIYIERNRENHDAVGRNSPREGQLKGQKQPLLFHSFTRLPFPTTVDPHHLRHYETDFTYGPFAIFQIAVVTRLKIEKRKRHNLPMEVCERGKKLI